MRVYKFIDLSHGLGSISLKRLKVSTFDNLNDPFEFLSADLLDKRDRAALKAFKDQLTSTKGMLCFSSSWSNPLLWGHYANRHEGIALGFDIPDQYLLKVKYTTQRIKVVFDETSRKVVNSEDVARRLIDTKFIDWKYENEYRMFVDIDTKSAEGGLHFMDFSEHLLLREVVLGMRCSLPVSRMRGLLSEAPEKVRVLKAGMALRNFKMIEDRSARVT